MKALRIIGIVVGALVALVLVASALMPSHIVVQRSAVIDRSPEQVQAYAGDLKNMMVWSTWAKMDPNQKVDFPTPASGVGAYWAWEGEKTGKGKLTNTKVEPGRIEQDLEFAGEAPAKVWWTFVPEGSGTEVTWAFETDLPFLQRVMGPMIDGMLGGQYEEGLKNLKAEIEQQPAAAAAAAPTDTTAAPAK